MIGGVTIVQCIIILVVVDGIITVPLCISLVSITEIGICSCITGGNLISHPVYIASIGITQLVHMFMRLKA